MRNCHAAIVFRNEQNNLQFVEYIFEGIFRQGKI